MSRFFILAALAAVMFGLLIEKVEAEPREKFNHASFLMDQQNYEEAYTLYREIEESGYLSGPLYLNMAIALYRQDSLGVAKYYFMKAGEFNQTRSEAVEALRYIDEQIEQQYGSVPELLSSVWRDRIQFEIGIWNLIITGIILLNIGAILLAFGWIKPKLLFVMKCVGIPLLACSVLVLLLGSWLEYHAEDFERGVIVEQEVIIHSEPSEASNEISIAYEGYTVTHNKPKSLQHPEWSYITLSNGVEGWVPSTGLRNL